MRKTLLLFIFYFLFKFILTNRLPGGSLLVKSRYQQQATVTELSILQMLYAVLISVTFCSSMADR